MAVSFYNFADLHHKAFREEIKGRISKIIDDGAFIEGEYNLKFEKEFAVKQGAKHCLLVANGTDALEIALQAHGVGPGDKVGVPGITFYATAEAVINIGAEPVFIDVDPVSACMCPESLKRVLAGTKLAAIMPVHIYGLPAPIKALEAICQPAGIPIIEDAAQAQGTFVDGKPVGSTNNFVTFSFYPTKNLSAFGDAGAILCQDDQLATIVKTIRNHGRGDANRLGRNSRCDHMQAAVLDLKMGDIDGYNQDRKKVAAWYNEALKELEVEILPDHYIESSSWHLYPIKLANKDQRVGLQEHLKNQGIGTTPFYERAMSQEKALGGYSGEDTVAKSLAGRMLCLPMNPFVTKDDVKEVAREIANFLN